MTTPSTGERITVRSRSMRAWFSTASRCLTTAAALRAWARATSTCACATFSDCASVAAVLRVVSTSAIEMKFCAYRSCLRFRSRAALSASSWALPAEASAALMLASPVSAVARAASTSAVAWLTLDSKLCGSMRAITWPFVTSWL